jgi:hypothetical protein
MQVVGAEAWNKCSVAHDCGPRGVPMGTNSLTCVRFGSTISCPRKGDNPGCRTAKNVPPANATSWSDGDTSINDYCACERIDYTHSECHLS